MRKLVTTDVFEALRLVKKSGLKEELAPLIKDIAQKGTSAIDSGIMGILTVVEIFAENKCEQMIYGLLAGPFEMKPEEVAGLELDVLAEKLEQLGKENDIRRFFTVLSGLLSKTR